MAVVKKQETCPNCGHCPHCGRSAQPPVPSVPWYVPWYVPYPYQPGPVWISPSYVGDPPPWQTPTITCSGTQ